MARYQVGTFNGDLPEGGHLLDEINSLSMMERELSDSNLKDELDSIETVVDESLLDADVAH